jgi:uncharacterized protein YbjT (DUF2867 family)
MQALVLGSTGVVGDAIVREALQDGRIGSVVAVARRPLQHGHPRLTVVVHEDFKNFAPLEARLAPPTIARSSPPPRHTSQRARSFANIRSYFAMMTSQR